jgi:hypothetical protein
VPEQVSAGWEQPEQAEEQGAEEQQNWWEAGQTLYTPDQWGVV